MKTKITRISVIIAAVGLGTLIFILLLFAGDKSKGPLENLLASVKNGVSHFEKQVLGYNSKDSRSASLKWFDRYRNTPSLIKHPDVIFTGAYDDNIAESFENIVALEDSLKTKLPIIQIYTAWGGKETEVFPTLRSQAIYDLGSMPMITWEPWLDDFDAEKFPTEGGLKDKNKSGLKRIASGEYDTYIDQWASDAKKFGEPFFLRFAHEMNDPYRYPWGPQNNKSADYIAAWKHVHDRFQKAGARNAIWIWSPHQAYSTYSDFYPGEGYVDWIGVTALNYGTVAPWSQWWSFEDIIGKFYKNVSLYNKPMMITELGSLEVGGSRPLWFKQALDSLPKKYPALKAVIFFHASSDNTTTYKALDWSFKSDKKTVGAIKGSFNIWYKKK